MPEVTLLGQFEPQSLQQSLSPIAQQEQTPQQKVSHFTSFTACSPISVPGMPISLAPKERASD